MLCIISCTIKFYWSLKLQNLSLYFNVLRNPPNRDVIDVSQAEVDEPAVPVEEGLSEDDYVEEEEDEEQGEGGGEEGDDGDQEGEEEDEEGGDGEMRYDIRTRQSGHRT